MYITLYCVNYNTVYNILQSQNDEQERNMVNQE